MAIRTNLKKLLGLPVIHHPSASHFVSKLIIHTPVQKWLLGMKNGFIDFSKTFKYRSDSQKAKDIAHRESRTRSLSMIRCKSRML